MLGIHDGGGAGWRGYPNTEGGERKEAMEAHARSVRPVATQMRMFCCKKTSQRDIMMIMQRSISIAVAYHNDVIIINHQICA